MRVVLDTNVLVSLVLVRGGRLGPLWDAWRAGRLVVLAGEESLLDVEQVLARPKLARHVDAAATAALLRDLRMLTSHVALRHPHPPFRDEKDRFLLALARDGNADALITGDHALQALGRLDHTIVATPAEIVAVLAGP